MNKDIIYITDSSLHNLVNSYPLYSIISLCGSDDYIEYLTRSFKDIFNGSLQSVESFSEWYKLEENSNILLDFLSKLDIENSNCKFISYLSDHDFSKFLLYINTLIKINNDKEIINNLDSIYINFDKTQLQYLDTNITESKLTEVNKHIISILDSLRNNNLISKNVSQSTIPLDKQMKNIVEMSETVFKDMSTLDYVHYTLSLLRLSNELGVDSILGITHSVNNINLCVNSFSCTNQSNIYINFENRITPEIIENNILLNNFAVIFDYVWNKLHDCTSIDTMSKNDRLLTIYMWLLFQSEYSTWMITSIDFNKIKLIFNDFK